MGRWNAGERICSWTIGGCAVPTTIGFPPASGRAADDGLDSGVWARCCALPSLHRYTLIRRSATFSRKREKGKVGTGSTTMTTEKIHTIPVLPLLPLAGRGEPALPLSPLNPVFPFSRLREKVAEGRMRALVNLAADYPRAPR